MLSKHLGLSLRDRKVFAAILALVILCSGISAFIAYDAGVKAQSGSTTFTLTGGVYPGAPSYTIYTDGTTYYAKNSYGTVSYSSTNATYVVDSALASVSGTTQETILLKGSISFAPGTLGSGAFTPKSYTTIIIDGLITSTASGVANDYVFWLQNVNHVEIKGGIINCAGETNGIGIIDGCSDITINNVEIQTPNGIGIAVTRSGPGISVYSIRTTIEYCKITNATNNAVYIFYSQGFDKINNNFFDTITSAGVGHSLFLTDNCFNNSELKNNYLYNTAESGIYIGGGDGGLVNGNHITNATVGGGVRYDYGSGVVISNNYIQNAGTGISSAVAVSNRVISGNTIIGATREGINLYQDVTTMFDYYTVTNNVISGYGTYGVKGSNVRNSVISANVITNGGTNDAIYLGARCQNVTVSTNLIDSDAAGIGIRLDGALGFITLTGNNIKKCVYGIYFNNANNSVATGNTILQCSGSGFLVGGATTHFSITGNSISYNTNEGIYIIAGNHGLIVGNTLTNNGSNGIDCEVEGNILIDSNDLSSNTGGATNMHGTTNIVGTNITS